MHGNINFVWNKLKDQEKFPLVFHKKLYLHGIFPSIDRKKHTLKEKRTKGLVVQIPPAAPAAPCIQTILEGGGDVYRGGDMSTVGVTRL